MRKWSVIGLLALGMMIAFVDRANLSVVLTLKEFRQVFPLTDSQRGLLNSAFFWSYALLQIPAGWVVDRYGVKWPYAIGFLFWTIVSCLTGFVHTVGQLVAMRLLLGLGESIVSPASLRWIRFHCPERERGLAIGIYFAGNKIGAAIGVPVTALLITAFDWRLMFPIVGLGGLIWLIGWLALVRNNDREIEREAVALAPADAVSFGRVMASPVMWGIILGTFSYSYFLYFSLTWLPAYFVESRNLSLNSMSLFTFFSFGGMAVTSALAGWLADMMIRRGRDPVTVRKGFTILGLIVASSEVIGAFSKSQSVALFFAVFSLTGLGLATANYWALTQTIIPGGAVGRIAGVQNCASNLSGIVAPILTGWLKEVTGSYDAPLKAIWFVLLLGIASYVFLVRPRYAPRA
ncbi:MAG: MFS transporter [Acidobacteriota bacterium]|nr:MFS transporter [Acidobacteriota bacterium]